MSHRRIILGMLASAAALVAIPSAANAATCTYDPATAEMNVRYGPTDTAVTLANNGDLQYSESGGFMRSCYSPTGVAARAANTAKLTVKGFSGSGPQRQVTTFDERGGNIIDGNPNMDVFLFTGTGGDRVIFREGAGTDVITLTDSPGIGPAADLDNNGTVDFSSSLGFDSVVEVYGGGSGDLINAMNASTFQILAFGEGGVDTLLGTKKGGDTLDGGSEGDYLYSYTDDQKDIVRGGSGVDKGTFDYGVDDVRDVENPAYG